MVTWEDFLNKAKDAAQVAGKKTGEFVDTTKIKMEISRTEREIAATYEGLGRLVYDAKKGAEDITELMDTCVEHIDELNAQVKELEEKLANLRNAVRCPACGKFNDEDSAFCKSCGEKL